MKNSDKKTFRYWKEQEFREFICSYGTFFIIFARKYTADTARAEDMVQDCLYRLWMERSAKHDIDNPTAFILRMIRNASLNAQRHDRRMLLQGWIKVEDSCDDDFLEALYKAENNHIIEKGLRFLPHNWQQVMDLALQGYSNEEIGKILCLTHYSVKAIKRRAIKRLREYISNYEPVDYSY